VHATAVVLVLPFSLLDAAATVQAQTVGSLSGTVTDPSGAAVVRAKLRVQRASTTRIQETTSDEQDHYEFRDVAPGVYQISVQAPGFADLSKETAVSVNRAGKADLQLQTVSVVQQITVLASTSDPMTPDPSQRTFVRDELLDANPGRPGSTHLHPRPSR
jgi:hypothetical protein